MILLVFLAFFCIYISYELYWKRRNLLPGPCPLPVFGNLLSLNNPPPGYEAFERWTKKYGDVYTFWIGNTPYIMFNTYDKVMEHFVRDGDTYADKMRHPVIRLFRGGEYGIIDSNGALWKDHRRFALSTFRDFGMGKNLMQERILIEVRGLFAKFDATEGTETEVPAVFDNAIANVINQMLFGYSFDETNQTEFKKLKHIIDSPGQLSGKFHVFLAMYIPIVAKLLPRSVYEKPFEKFGDLSFTFFKKQIDQHKKDIDFSDLNSESSDYVEAYLKEQRILESQGDSESFSDVQLANMCMDLWFSGLGTTTITTAWAISYVLNFDEVQRKLHEELDKVIGSDRLVTTADKTNLPYMNAFISETQRCVNMVPLNLQHSTTRDTVINGYHIPKGTGAVAQISTITIHLNQRDLSMEMGSSSLWSSLFHSPLESDNAWGKVLLGWNCFCLLQIF